MSEANVVTKGCFVSIFILSSLTWMKDGETFRPEVNSLLCLYLLTYSLVARLFRKCSLFFELRLPGCLQCMFTRSHIHRLPFICHALLLHLTVWITPCISAEHGEILPEETSEPNQRLNTHVPGCQEASGREGNYRNNRCYGQSRIIQRVYADPEPLLRFGEQNHFDGWEV